MLRALVVLGGSVIGIVGSFVMIVVLVLAPIGARMSPESGSHITGVAMAAEALQDHIYGAKSNVYDDNDPFMKPVYQFWVEACGSGGVICDYAISGNLQCVQFVTATFFLNGTPLPYAPDAIDFWSGYAHRDGWDRFSVTESYPHTGDMMIWQGGVYGHIAIVLDVSLPAAGSEGYVTVAQANGTGNRWAANNLDQPGNWYKMPLLPNGTVLTWDGFQVLGYIRPHV